MNQPCLVIDPLSSQLFHPGPSDTGLQHIVSLSAVITTYHVAELSSGQTLLGFKIFFGFWSNIKLNTIAVIVDPSWK